VSIGTRHKEKREEGGGNWFNSKGEGSKDGAERKVDDRSQGHQKWRLGGNTTGKGRRDPLCRGKRSGNDTEISISPDDNWTALSVKMVFIRQHLKKEKRMVIAQWEKRRSTPYSAQKEIEDGQALGK